MVWDNDMFDSDGEDMSLAVTKRLANEKFRNRSRCFDNLDNDIMLQVAAEVDPWEPKNVSALGHDTKAARDERMRSPKERETVGIFVEVNVIYIQRGGLVSFNQTTISSSYQKYVC